MRVYRRARPVSDAALGRIVSDLERIVVESGVRRESRGRTTLNIDVSRFGRAKIALSRKRRVVSIGLRPRRIGAAAPGTTTPVVGRVVSPPARGYTGFVPDSGDMPGG